MAKKQTTHVALVKTQDNKSQYLLPKNSVDGISVEAEFTGLGSDTTLGVYLPTIDIEESAKTSRSPFGIFNLDPTTVSDDLFNKIIDNEVDSFTGSSSSSTSGEQLPFGIQLLSTISLSDVAVNSILGN